MSTRFFNWVKPRSRGARRCGYAEVIAVTYIKDGSTATARISRQRNQETPAIDGKTSGLFDTIVSFVDAHGNPLGGNRWRVRVCDKDALLYEYLGSSALDAEGKAYVLITVADISSVDSPDESRPDLYFVLYDEDLEVIRTEALPDGEFEERTAPSGDTTGIAREFGPYVYRSEF